MLLWTPAYSQSKAGPTRTYIQQLCDDTGCNPEDLPKAMNDRETWRERVRDIRASRTSWWWWSSYVIKAFLINKGVRTIAFIFIVISTMFQPTCPPAFFNCLLNSGTFMELRTTSFIESTGVVCSDTVSHNRVQLLSIPVLLPDCQDWTCNLQIIVSFEA